MRNLPSTYGQSVGFRQLFVHVPDSWTCILMQHRVLSNTLVACFYSLTYYFYLPFFTPLFRFGYSTEVRILWFTLRTLPAALRLFWQHLTHLFVSFLKPFLVKLKFKGKGYYVFKGSRQTITPQFGFAHRRYFYAPSLRVKFLSKTKIVLFGFSKQDLFHTAYAFQTYKPINVFTGRGVRFAKQVIYRKTGKVSLYR